MENVGRYPTTLLLYVLTDGVEYSSSGFWAQIYQYRWREWYEEDQETPKASLTPATVLLQVRDYESQQDEEEVWVDVTLAKLAEALDWAIDHYNHTFTGYHTTNEGIRDDVGYDAISADIVIQKIVLGEVVYG